MLADIDLGTLNLDPAAADAAVTPRTAALLPVHFAGRPAPLARLGGIARHGRGDDAAMRSTPPRMRVGAAIQVCRSGELQCRMVDGSPKVFEINPRFSGASR